MLKRTVLSIFLLICILRPDAIAEVIDRVVAFVDTEAITLSELNEAYDTMAQLAPDVTKHEVLNTMINRLLLLREANRLRLETENEDRLLDEYIDMKVRAFIKIKETDIQKYYESNISEFENRPYDEVKDEIEAYLLEKEVNFRIRQYLDSLKENAHIKILLETP